jgi:hypothetical protein
MYDGILVIITETNPEPFPTLIHHRSNFILQSSLVCFTPFQCFFKWVYLYLVLNLFNDSDFH